jgi:hypothetical protein
VDSKLTVVVPLGFEVVVLLFLLLLVAFIVLHPNYGAEGGDRDEFNVLLLDFAVKFPGGRPGRGEAARAPHQVSSVVSLHGVGPQLVLSEGRLKWLQGVLDPANAVYDFLVDKVLRLQAPVEFGGTWHARLILVLLRLIEGHRVATAMRGPDGGPRLWGSLTD